MNITLTKILQVIDSTKKHGEYDDLSKVEKFELSEDSYDQRNGKLSCLSDLIPKSGHKYFFLFESD